MATARKPRTAAPRKPRTIKSVSLPDGVIELDAATDDRSLFENTTPLFSINGVVYEARTSFSAGETIRYARLWREHPDLAMEYAMTQALGEDGYQAFLDYPYLSADKAGQIVSQIVDRIAPRVAGPK